MEININYVTDKSHVSRKNNTSIHHNYREHNDTSRFRLSNKKLGRACAR